LLAFVVISPVWRGLYEKASSIDRFVQPGRRRGLEDPRLMFCAVDLESLYPDGSPRHERNVKNGSPQKSREEKEQKTSPREGTKDCGRLSGPRTASPQFDERVAQAFE
jgi:hypothetical protein